MWVFETPVDEEKVFSSEGYVEIVMALVTKIGDTLEYASDKFKSDKEIVMAAVSNDGNALENAASVAGTMLITEAVVSNVKDKKASPSMDPSMMM